MTRNWNVPILILISRSKRVGNSYISRVPGFLSFHAAVSLSELWYMSLYHGYVLDFLFWIVLNENSGLAQWAVYKFQIK